MNERLWEDAINAVLKGMFEEPDHFAVGENGHLLYNKEEGVQSLGFEVI